MYVCSYTPSDIKQTILLLLLHKYTDMKHKSVYAQTVKQKKINYQLSLEAL